MISTLTHLITTQFLHCFDAKPIVAALCRCQASDRNKNTEHFYGLHTEVDFPITCYINCVNFPYRKMCTFDEDKADG